MSYLRKVALVLGATGQQGGAVARQLLTSGWSVRALVRDPQKAEAQELHNLGIELVKGDLDLPATLAEAMQDVQGVFSVQAILYERAKEVQQGKAVAEAAKAMHVPHLVYSSAIGANRDIGIAAFEAKGEIERYLQALKLPVTILRPAMFMDNFRFQARRVNGSIYLPALGDAETSIQAIAVRDIGVFAALALNDPQTYIGKALEIAGDELTLARLAEVFQQVFGLPVVYQAGSSEAGQDLQGARKASAFLAKEGLKADIASLRQIHPQLLSLEAWLRQAALPL
ncbi:NAD-dependent epimerase/dehydratase family protein [Ktedonosporobacter rubrisoli]|uniref:NAD-dependent epimerase/dehydratase family protein n=1 Tax=Ktedonosporobacter rubrisoli TaxID=2509675 RepID=A0A4P6JSQ3_KTERU|nr:NmrA/HSCARG family protein [Ktedonosporobacter rubrisoli]QBD78588.1 NAD-dependent epimerase/dehydratase family protein [Ktedonosporobacter rubrisoli]